MPKRFLKLTEISEILDCSPAQASALVRSGDLPAIKVGGRGQWRIEISVFEQWITDQYAATARYVAEHPFTLGDDSTEAPDAQGTSLPAGSDA